MNSQTFDNEVDAEVNAHNLEAGNEIVQGGEPQPPKAKRARVTNANWWKYFTKLKTSTDGIGREKCNTCVRVFKADGKAYGTKTLNRHRIRCSKTKQTGVVQVMMDLQGKLETRAIDKKSV